MTLFSLRTLSLAVAVASLSLASCSKDNDPQPTPTTAVAAQTQQLTTGNWRLDQIKEGGQVTSSGNGIKDQYSLTFRANGTYTQKLLADNSTYEGTWMLMNNNSVLHLVDHKGTSNQYTLSGFSATEMRYTFTNKNNVAEERIFSAQP